MNDRLILSILCAILYMGKKMGNPRSHPNWPDTIIEAKTILDLVDNELAEVPEPDFDDVPDVWEIVDAKVEEVDEGDEPKAAIEGDDFEIDDLL